MRVLLLRKNPGLRFYSGHREGSIPERLLIANRSYGESPNQISVESRLSGIEALAHRQLTLPVPEYFHAECRAFEAHPSALPVFRPSNSPVTRC